MKYYINVTLLLLVTHFVINAQINDPYVNLLSLSPNSPYATNNLPFVAVSGSATFRIGAQANPQYDDLEWGTNTGCTDEACKLKVTVIPTSGKTIITGIPTSGTFSNKFDWVILPDGSLLGTQKEGASGLIESPNGGSGSNPGTQGTNWGTVVVPIQHIAPSTILDPVGQTHPCSVPGNLCTTGFNLGFNGVVVNVQPPTQPSNNNQPTANDNIGAYVYARTKLPIQYTDLTLVDKQESGIQLLWKTINETNTKEFDIERKYDNSENWLVIGKSNASGNTVGETSYKFLDNTYVYRPKVYYRVKAIDNDGKYTYTNIRSINLAKTADLKMTGYPNPVQNIYHLTFISKKEENLDLSVIDPLGRTVSTKSVSSSEGTNFYDIDVTTLPQGAYIVKLSGADHQETIKFVKN